MTDNSNSAHDDKPKKILSLNKSATATSKKGKPHHTGPRARRIEQAAYQRGEGKISARKIDKYGVQALGKHSAAYLSRYDESFPDPELAKEQKHKPTLKHVDYTPTNPTLMAGFASCPHGLEEVLAKEFTDLGFEGVKISRAGVHFSCDALGFMKANLYSRLATRILCQVAHAVISCEDDLYQLAYGVDWSRWFGPKHALRVDTSAVHCPFQSLQFCNLKVKDAICDKLRATEGDRPSIDTVRPDARVHCFLNENSATLYIDTTGESLFKRGWRLDKGQAPLRENLAAGILALSGWQPGQVLVDPFCGSGTILIEAAWKAQNVPPGIFRPFQFERLRTFNEKAWKELKAQAYSQITDARTLFIGSDIDPHMCEVAKANMERAHINAKTIHFETKHILDVTAPGDHGFIVTNPPYGVRMGTEYDKLWHPWSAQLKSYFDGWQVYVITNDLNLPKKMRLKPKRRFPLYNGNLECRLFAFDIVKESFRDPQ